MLRAADFVILVTEPTPLSLASVVTSVRNLIEPTGVAYRVLINKVDPRVPGVGQVSSWPAPLPSSVGGDMITARERA